MKRYIKKLLKKLGVYRSRENGSITLIGTDSAPVKVCDIVNGRPRVTRKDNEDTAVFVLRYSLFRREVKRYDKKTFKELH